MPGKNPTWTRKRFGRDKVHWVAYDDAPGAEGGRNIVAQGYASSLPEADAAARAALAEAGMYRSRRTSTGFARPKPADRPEAPRAARPKPSPRREYLYTRLHDAAGVPYVAAHLVVKKTPKKVHVTVRSCGPDQVGTEDERWDEGEESVTLDRDRLEREGSAFSSRFRDSDFFRTREAAMGDAAPPEADAEALGALGLRAPCTAEDIKAAYRRRALEVHPDRGGTPADFQAVEDAYRHLLRAARS